MPRFVTQTIQTEPQVLIVGAPGWLVKDLEKIFTRHDFKAVMAPLHQFIEDPHHFLVQNHLKFRFYFIRNMREVITL